CNSFIREALEEIKKFENGSQNRQDTAWNIVGIAIKLKLFDLIQAEKVPQVIKNIVDLASDLEVPDDVYEGDVNEDMKKLISLVKNYSEIS
ncbi:MAG: hypothetical protein QW367_01200, partial [Candidatus Aenigmatarchaeota archaeon]